MSKSPQDGVAPQDVRGRKCYLFGHGDCRGAISKEHYISKTVLDCVVHDNTIQIGGLRWQPTDTLQKVGINSLTAKILCERHNSSLSSLDSAAGKLFRAIDDADKRPEVLDASTSIEGMLISRWFLKVLCGLAAGSGFNNGLVPVKWVEPLLGGDWPEGWGLYIPVPQGEQILAREFYIETLVNPNTKEILAARFRVAGVLFSLVLGTPDYPDHWGIKSPRSLVFSNENSERRIDFLWPRLTDRVVTYKKIGTTTARPPQFDGWKE